MGICIYLKISKSVTAKEWENVYQETLLLVKNLPLAERVSKTIHGIDNLCLVRTKETTVSYRWNKEKTRTGWFADGDYITMRQAEDYFLPKNLVSEGEYEQDAGDAIMGYLPACLNNVRWEDERCQHVYDLWGAKTQGEPYHIYLLAVACLIESRLKEKVLISGDITRGQCRKAVEIANKYLEQPIEMPDRCYPDRLLNRITKLDLSEMDKLKLFERLYLGTKDFEFGECLRSHFSKRFITMYWKKRFARFNVRQSGFHDIFHEYMLMGFDLKELCSYVNLKDQDGNSCTKTFVQMVMDAKLHLKDKNCTDLLQIDPESEATYGVSTLLMQFCFAGARNKKIDRYIPIEEIRDALKKGLRKRSDLDIDSFIDEYLKKEEKQKDAMVTDINQLSEETIEKMIEQDASECFDLVMKRKQEQMQKNAEEYNITDYDELKFYIPGDTIHPALATALGNSRKFLDTLLKQECYIELLSETPFERCKWIAEQNQHQFLVLKDVDWEKIYSDIEDNKDSFGRYYSIMSVKMDNSSLVQMCIGLMINDALYAYSKELANQIIDDDISS